MKYHIQVNEAGVIRWVRKASQACHSTMLACERKWASAYNKSQAESLAAYMIAHPDTTGTRILEVNIIPV